MPVVPMGMLFDEGDTIIVGHKVCTVKDVVSNLSGTDDWLFVQVDGTDEVIQKAASEINMIRIVLWCNGSTTDSGSVSRGSNPRRTT